MKYIKILRNIYYKIYNAYRIYGLKITLKKIFEYLLLFSTVGKKVIHYPPYVAHNNNLLDNALDSYIEYTSKFKAINYNSSSSLLTKITNQNIKVRIKQILQVAKNLKNQINLFESSNYKSHNYINLPTYKRKTLPLLFPKVDSLINAKGLMICSRGTSIPKELEIKLQNATHSLDIKSINQLYNPEKILDYDFIVLYNIPMEDKLRIYLKAAQMCYIPSFFWYDNLEENKNIQLSLLATDFVISSNPKNFNSLRLECKNTFFIDSKKKETKLEQLFISAMQQYKSRHLPTVSIVTILYKKAHEIEPVLESYIRQSYVGDIEIIFVDDCSPDNSSEVVRNFFTKAKINHLDLKFPNYKIIKNEYNLGNCNSRNKGIELATGDLVIVIDADCMINRDFIENHVASHSFEDCDVVIGPFNIESGHSSPLEVLEKFEHNPEMALAKCELQDSINRASFLNCITRNFSIKRKLITSELFDPDFSYSADPDSGFGWEDVEMGYRLYQQGLRIKFIPDAYSIHITHSSTTSDGNKPLRSLKNFRRLFEKHPELTLVARRWTLDTYEKICNWIDKNNLPLNDDRRYLDNLFQKFLPAPFFINKKTTRRLKILSYPWHISHQYEIYKLPHDFTLVTDLGTNLAKGWDFTKRPLRENVTFEPIKNINTKDFDLAILHFDENVLTPENTNGVLGLDWGKSFKYFRNNIDLPKVAICHGTPQFYGQYDHDYRKSNLMEEIENEKQRIVEYLGDILTITNSYQAGKEWNFKNTKVIWHGFDPSEFSPSTYKKGILTPFGTPLISRPYYRGYYVFKEVFEDFPKEFSPQILQVREPNILYQGNQYAYSRFRNYVDDIRQYSIYFNSTIRSPMPRSRGEAMMCGLATVSLQNHDVDLFIKNGINGFYSEDPGELREYLLHLAKNPQQAKKIGLKGRELAMDIFNHDRFLQAWQNTIKELV